VVIQEISQAKKTVNVAMYYFTSMPLAEALVRVERRGVEVRVYLEESQKTGRYSKMERGWLGYLGGSLGNIGGSEEVWCLILSGKNLVNTYIPRWSRSKVRMYAVLGLNRAEGPHGWTMLEGLFSLSA